MNPQVTRACATCDAPCCHPLCPWHAVGPRTPPHLCRTCTHPSRGNPDMSTHLCPTPASPPLRAAQGLLLLAAAAWYLLQTPGVLAGAIDTYIKAPLQVGILAANCRRTAARQGPLHSCLRAQQLAGWMRRLGWAGLARWLWARVQVATRGPCACAPLMAHVRWPLVARVHACPTCNLPTCSAARGPCACASHPQPPTLQRRSAKAYAKEDFVMGRKLASGGFGTVRSCSLALSCTAFGVLALARGPGRLLCPLHGHGCPPCAAGCVLAMACCHPNHFFCAGIPCGDERP